MVVHPDDFPFMVVGNKSDLADTKRAVSVEQAQYRANQLGNGIEFIETSAQNNTNV